MSEKKLQLLKSVALYDFDQSRIEQVYKQFIRLQCTYLEDRQVRAFDEGRVFYTLKFNRLEDKIPHLLGYDARLRYVPPIHHGVFFGIDTYKMERDLYAFDWFNSQPGKYGLADASLVAFNELWKKMERLINTGEQAAIDVVQQLQVKHWAGTLVENYTCLDLMTLRYDKYYDFSLNKEQRGITAECAYHLLCGRPVLKIDSIDINKAVGYWMQLKRPTTPNRFRSLVCNHYPEYDLPNALNVLTRKENIFIENADAVIAGLKQGKAMQASQSTGDHVYPVLLIAEPEHQTVRVEHSQKKLSMTSEIRKEVRPAKRKGPSL